MSQSYRTRMQMRDFAEQERHERLREAQSSVRMLGSVIVAAVLVAAGLLVYYMHDIVRFIVL